MKKNIFILLAFLFLLSCNTEPSKPKVETETSPAFYHKIKGKTMGTSYNVICAGGEAAQLKTKLDDLLLAINLEVSTYIDTATISLFNHGSEAVDLGEEDIDNIHFQANFVKAKSVFEKTKGAFDPTIMPLVNYWGFGYTPKRKVTNVDSIKIAELIKTVGFEKVEMKVAKAATSLILTKENPATQLDFSAIAKGYGVDALTNFLEKEGITDYFVEIGGETRTKGKNPKGNKWRIGINTPEASSSTEEIYSIVELSEGAIATSGNYRNYHEVNGGKYGHTINPKTGFPEMNSTLSASVIAKDCMTADAYATAFMTMGYEKAIPLVESIPDIEAYLIYAEADGTMVAVASSGMKQYLK